LDLWYARGATRVSPSTQTSTGMSGFAAIGREAQRTHASAPRNFKRDGLDLFDAHAVEQLEGDEYLFC